MNLKFKILIVISFFGFFCGTASADLKVPPMSAGVFYSMKDHAINHGETFTAITIKDYINLELGYAGDADEADNKAISALTLTIPQLALKNYVTFPILDLIEFRPAIYAGLGNINIKDMSGAKFDWGFGATLISAKF